MTFEGIVGLLILWAAILTLELLHIVATTRRGR